MRWTRRSTWWALAALGAAATVVVPNVVQHMHTSSCRKDLADINGLGNATQLFHERAGRLPVDLSELVDQGYLKGRSSVPLDPWKREYVYWRTDSDRACTIGTFGHDGSLDGRGDVLLRLRVDGSGLEQEWIAGPRAR